MNKSVKRTLIGLGIFVAVVVVITIIFFVFMFISTGVAFFKKEFTPDTKSPTRTEETISTTTEETKEKPQEIESLEKEENLYVPTISLEIAEGPTKVGDIYFVRVEAIVTGKPSPEVKFNRDDSKGAWGENIVQVNLYPYAGYLLKANAKNSKGSASANILLMVDDKGNLIKSDKNVSGDLIIDDLAYIKIMCGPYSDDADPEEDGISIDIEFYNSKSKHISFEGILVTANIKLYATRIDWDTGEEKIIEPAVYEGNFKIDHSMRLSEMFGKYIRVPYEEIGLLPDKEYPWGKIIVTAITQLQGKFEAEEKGVSLAPY